MVERMVVVVVVVDSVFVHAVHGVEEGGPAATMVEGEGTFGFMEVALFKRNGEGETETDAAWAFTFDRREVAAGAMAFALDLAAASWAFAAADDEVDDRNERKEIIGEVVLLHIGTEDEDDDAAATEANSFPELTVTEETGAEASPPDAADGAVSGAAEAAGAAAALETGVEVSVSASALPVDAQICFAKASVACWSLALQADSIFALISSMKPVLPQMHV